MVKCMNKLLFGEVVDELLVFAFFFVPFVNFSPVACGVVVLCSLFSLIGGVSGIMRNRPNVMFVLVFAFMIYASLSSLLLHAEACSFTRLQFQIRLPLLLFALAFLIRGRIPSRRAMKSFAFGSYGMALIVLLAISWKVLLLKYVF